jgi:hypothetical protein
MTCSAKSGAIKMETGSDLYTYCAQQGYNNKVGLHMDFTLLCLVVVALLYIESVLIIFLKTDLK